MKTHWGGDGTGGESKNRGNQEDLAEKTGARCPCRRGEGARGLRVSLLPSKKMDNPEMGYLVDRLGEWETGGRRGGTGIGKEVPLGRKVVGGKRGDLRGRIES